MWVKRHSRSMAKKPSAMLSMITASRRWDLVERLLGLLEVRDVDEGDDHPLDAVVLRAVGHDAADIPPAVVGLHLPGERGQIDQHPARIVQQGLVTEPQEDVRRSAGPGRRGSGSTGG